MILFPTTMKWRDIKIRANSEYTVEKKHWRSISRLWPVPRSASVVFAGPSWHRKNSPAMTWVGGFPKSEVWRKKSGHLIHLILTNILSWSFSHPVLNILHVSISTISFTKQNPRPQGLSLMQHSRLPQFFIILGFFVAHSMDSFCSQYLYFSMLALLPDLLHYSPSIFFSSTVLKCVCTGFCK